MWFSLTRSLTRWLLLAGIVLATGFLSFEAAKLWRADSQAHSPHPEDWLRAAELEPGNAAYWYRLGWFRQSDFEQLDLAQAILHYERATEINPRSATYWMGLASAYEMAGKPDRARGAFERARASYPISPDVAWSYGNFLLRQGQLSAAFAEIQRALLRDSRRTAFAVAQGWRFSQDVERLLDELLPPEGHFYLQAVHYFLSQQLLDPALAVWNRLLALKEPFELRRAFPLLDALVQEERLDEAKTVWQQALRAAGLPETGAAEESLVWDGGFERELSNGGFGWRQPRISGAWFDFDTTSRRSGARALRIRFDGTANLNFQHLVQYVPVNPRRRYRFKAFVRTEGISTDSGLRFRIFDPHRPAALDILTPNLVGTEPWSLQEVEFTTGPETRLLALALRRIPSKKLDNKLRGSVWIDEVSLIPLAATRRRQGS